jgi:hypothetical protein
LELRRDGQYNEIYLHARNKPIGRLRYFISHNGKILRPQQVDLNGNTIEANFGTAVLIDRVEEQSHLIIVHRRWDLTESGKWKLFFNYNVMTPHLNQWAVPSVVYHDNQHGQGRFPKGGIDRGWSFREDRIPIPSCAILYDRKGFQAVFTAPAQNENTLSSIKTFMEDHLPAFEICIPFTEQPHTYTEKGIVGGGLTRESGRDLMVKRHETPFSLDRRFFIALAENLPHSVYAYETIFRAALNQVNPDTGNRIIDWGKVATLKLKHLRFLLVDKPKKGIVGIKTGKGNGLLQPYYQYLMSSFLGRNIEGALVLAKAGMELQDRTMVATAERIGRFFLNGCLDNGLHRDTYDLKRRRWSSYCGPAGDKTRRNGANSRSNGETMHAYLRLYHLLKEADIHIPEFKVQVDKNAAFFIAHQLGGEEAGSFGRCWRSDGRVLNAQGTNGAYIISFLAALRKDSLQPEKIDSALELAAAYYGSLVDKNAYYADTLDADCVDKEAGAALMRAFLDLYEIYGNEAYLEKARRAASFVLSWTWLYDVRFPDKSPAAREGLKTTGLTAVSIAHHHLDFYGISCGYDFLRLWQATGEARWRQYALLMIEACAQLIATKDNPLGRSEDFIGWQPEQVNQTNWDYIHRYRGTKGNFHFCVAWNVVLFLGALFDIRERYPQIIDFNLAPNEDDRQP